MVERKMEPWLLIPLLACLCVFCVVQGTRTGGFKIRQGGVSLHTTISRSVDYFRLFSSDDRSFPADQGEKNTIDSTNF